MRLFPALLTLAAAAGVAGVAFARNLDRLVRDALEKYGSRALTVLVSVREVHMDPRHGRGTVLGLSVANPPGFPGKLLTAEKVVLEVDLTTLTGKVVLIRVAAAEGVRVAYALDGAGRSNFDVLAARIRAGRPPPGPAGPPAETRRGTKRLAVSELSLRGIVVRVATGPLHLDVPISDVKLQGIGLPDGVAPGDLGGIVLDALKRAILPGLPL